MGCPGPSCTYLLQQILLRTIQHLVHCAIQKYYYCLVSRLCSEAGAHEGGEQADYYCYVRAIQSVNKSSYSFMMSFDSS
jgi:hypothetical protein